MESIRIHIICLRPEICSLIKKSMQGQNYSISCSKLEDINEDFIENFNERIDCLILDKDLDKELRNKIKDKIRKYFYYLSSVTGFGKQQQSRNKEYVRTIEAQRIIGICKQYLST